VQLVAIKIVSICACAVDNETNIDNIFLIGLMGAGKTTIGRQLARRLGKEFKDSDSEVEQRTGVGIDVIFDIEGEQGFRRRETEVLRELVATPKIHGIVLATGGGAVLAPENRQLLKENGFIIYLKSSAEHLADRLRLDRRRPLLQSGDKLAKIRDLMARREPVYEALADLVVETNERSIYLVVSEISNKIT